MRLKEGLKKTVTLKPAADGCVYREDDRLYRFDGGAAVTVRAVLQPIKARPDGTVYGEVPKAELLLLYDGGETLLEGMGVCVDVTEEMPCDYRIADQPRRYQSHKECTLAYIPPELRG